MSVHFASRDLTKGFGYPEHKSVDVAEEANGRHPDRRRSKIAWRAFSHADGLSHTRECHVRQSRVRLWRPTKSIAIPHATAAALLESNQRAKFQSDLN
jgi:hypothetical protein